MIFEQFYLNCLAQASYLIGDERAHTAVVVDPRRDIEPYLETAERHGLQIRHVFLTHLHADFVAGHLELRDRTGAAVHLGAQARAEYPFTAMKDGDALDLGAVRLQILETPGHTAESISILIYDLERTSSQPYTVLTGDALFIGDVGRPDLRAALGWSAIDLGNLLYDSLHTKLLALPDDTLLYPGHGAGSLCGKNISKDTVSTIGEQRRSNYALQPMTRESFIALVTADQPEAPPYFTYDAVLNSKERPTLDAVLERELTPLSLQQVLDMTAAAAQLLDTREPDEFARGHLPGALNIGLGGQYATWAGTLLSRDRPIVIVAVPHGEVEAATRLGRIGFDNVGGFLAGGMQALADHPDLLTHTERTSAAAAAESGSIVFVDVRTPHEWQHKRIENSRNVPLNHLDGHLAEIPRGSPVVVHCAAGYRSSIAVSLLQRAGFDNIVELTGGLAAWEAAKLPTV
jgi:hydroxyacylglutathione hydrolase